MPTRNKGTKESQCTLFGSIIKVAHPIPVQLIEDFIEDNPDTEFDVYIIDDQWDITLVKMKSK